MNKVIKNRSKGPSLCVFGHSGLQCLWVLQHNVANICWRDFRFSLGLGWSSQLISSPALWHHNKSGAKLSPDKEKNEKMVVQLPVCLSDDSSVTIILHTWSGHLCDAGKNCWGRNNTIRKRTEHVVKLVTENFFFASHTILKETLIAQCNGCLTFMLFVLAGWILTGSGIHSKRKQKKCERKRGWVMKMKKESKRTSFKTRTIGRIHFKESVGVETKSAPSLIVFLLKPASFLLDY